METLIVGAGAMGSLVGALLAENGAGVILYDIDESKVEAISRNGLVVRSGAGQRTVRVRATTDLREVGKIDLLILLVKSYDTGKAVEGVKECIRPETLILTLQNGLGNVEEMTRIIPSRQVLAGTTSHGAMLLSAGMIRHNGGAKTVIGPVEKSGILPAQRVARLLTRAGMETDVSADISGTLWTKLMANAAINPLTALTGRENGALLEDPDLRELMRKVVAEAGSVARAQGIRVQAENIFDYVQSVCGATRENKSSMLMDILNGRRTEIDAINGRVAILGQKCGVDTPVNECLTRLVRSLERGGKKDACHYFDQMLK